MSEYDDLVISGRPPKDPMKKVGHPVRCLVTLGVQDALIEYQDAAGIPSPRSGKVASDTIRIALYEHLKRKGLMTPELEQDATWDSLKERGLL